jgi:uncharacterized membrane protein
VIGDVARNLEILTPEQYVLAYVFLCSYALALGRLLERRGRLACAGIAAVAAVAFVARSAAWEPGVVAVAIALVGLGAVGASAWVFWTLANWHRPVHANALAPIPADVADDDIAPAPLAARMPATALNAATP